MGRLINVRTALSACAGFLLGACGGEGDTSASNSDLDGGADRPSMPWPFDDAYTERVPLPVQPTCNTNSLQLTGDIDGTIVDRCFSRSSHAVNQGSLPGTMDVVFGTSGSIHLAWDEVLVESGSVAVSGTLQMPEEGPQARMHTCLGAGSSLQTHPIPDGGRLYYFELRTLSEGLTCPGTSITGSLDGYLQTD